MSEYNNNNDLFLGSKTTQHGSHMVMTDVYKDTKVKYINIDTRFSDEYATYLANSTYQISQPTVIQPKTYVPVSKYTLTLPNRFTEVKNISVTNVEIPVSYFNISSNLGNNTFTVTDGSQGTKTVNIADGYYTQTQLVSSINSIIAGFGSQFSSDISFNVLSNTNNSSSSYFTTIKNNSVSNKLTINFAVDYNGNFNKYNFKFSLGWILGFRNTSYSINANGSAQSEAIADLSGPKYLYLAVDEFVSSYQNSFFSPLSSSLLNKNILARISMDTHTYPYGSILTANVQGGLLQSDKRQYNSKVDIQKLSVMLINENGTIMNMNGSDFSFCLEVEHE